MLIAGYKTPLELLQEEFVQLEYEGYLIDEIIKEQTSALHPIYDAYNEIKLNEIYSELKHLPKDPDFTFVQPNDLESIKKERPDGPRQLELKLDDDELIDRLHGAWTGRCVGCALGKPVEGLGMRGHGKLNGREAIRKYLQNRGQWKLDFYFSNEDAGDGITLCCQTSQREQIQFMPPDDDIHYSLIGLKVLEDTGPGFAWHDIADAWNNSLPYSKICTAEAQAILNYNILQPRTSKHKQEYGIPVTPEFTRQHNNPYREWIGAQIRADGWAYACAGNPELAAEFAWRDAHWTHTANGIYGEMFFAAVIAAAFVESDPRRLVEIGLSEIPVNCRLAHAIREAMIWIDGCDSFEKFMLRLEERFAVMSPVHTVNNAMIVIKSLFYGKMNPDRTAAIAVMGGLDTDCNGATTGSIAGATTGRKNFGGKMAASLNDTIKPMVFGFQEITMKELASRTLAVYRTTCEYAASR